MTKGTCKTCGHCKPTYKGGHCEIKQKKVKLTCTCDNWRAMIRQDSGAPYEEGWEPVIARDLHVGDEIIYERKHFDYKKGFPIESTYYRAIVGEHRTVAGMMFHLVNEPNAEFPEIAPWYGRWIYAENGAVEQMWRRIE